MSINSSEKVLRIAALTIVCFLTAPNALAGDGVIEINQAAALAGGITASDTPGFPVTLDAPGSYRLTGDLVYSDSVFSPCGLVDLTAVEITAEDVSLDLGGFSVSVSNTGQAGGDDCAIPIASSSDNLSIRNGTLIVADGFGKKPLEGALVSIERVRVVGFAERLQGAHGAIRHSSVDVFFPEYLDLGESGLAVGNHGPMIGKDALILDSVTDDFVDAKGVTLVTGSRIKTLGTSNNIYVAYGRNVISEGVTGNGTAFELGSNVCGTDTTCP